MIFWQKKFLQRYYRMIRYVGYLNFQDARRKALSQSMNASDVEREIREKIERTDREIADIQYKQSHISTDEQDLEVLSHMRFNYYFCRL